MEGAALIPAMLVFSQLVRNPHHAPPAYGFLLVVNTVLIILLEVPLNPRMERWAHHRALGTLLFAARFGGRALAGRMRRCWLRPPEPRPTECGFRIARYTW